jgi:hypothetical protein
MLVGVGDALVVLFLIFVLFGIGRGIAALPEGFNEIVALFVVGELLEGGSLFVGDDVSDVFVQPLLVGLAQFLLEGARILFALLLICRALQGINSVGRLRWGGGSLVGRLLACLRFIFGLVFCLVFGLILGDGYGGHKTQNQDERNLAKSVQSKPEHEGTPTRQPSSAYFRLIPW